jgi:hypothetical protein
MFGNVLLLHSSAYVTVHTADARLAVLICSVTLAYDFGGLIFSGRSETVGKEITVAVGTTVDHCWETPWTLAAF